MYSTKKEDFLNNSDLIIDAILSDDVSAFSEHVQSEEQAKKEIYFNQKVPKILQNCKKLLQFSAFFGATNIIDYLLGLDIDISSENYNEPTTIFYAAAGGNLPLFKKLLELDNTEQSFRCMTPCMGAAMMGRVDIVKYIWSRDKETITEKNSDQNQAIHYASQNGHTNVVDFLLSQGVDINEKGRDDCTPLIFAAESGSADLVKYLIEMKASIEDKTDNGMTALCIAARNGSLSVAKILVENGAQFNSTDDDSPLVEACGSGHLDLVKFFFEKGVKLDKETNDGLCLLKAAVRRNRINVFKYLLSKGIDINKTIDDMNILEYACTNNSNDIVEYLLGNSILSKDNISEKALEQSLERSASEVLITLIKYNVDLLNKKDLIVKFARYNTIKYPSDMEEKRRSFDTNYVLFDILEEYERIGKTKFGDVLKVASAKHNFDLLQFLYLHRDFDFNVFNVGPKKLKSLIKNRNNYAILFDNEELLKDPICRDLITNAVLDQRNSNCAIEAIKHGLDLPNSFLEMLAVLYHVYILEDEELFNKLLEKGVDLKAKVISLSFLSGESDDCITYILKDLNTTEIRDFHLKTLKTILKSGVDLFADTVRPISILFENKNQSIINIVKENLKLTPKIIENNALVNICIKKGCIEYFDWLLSFKPKIFRNISYGVAINDPFRDINQTKDTENKKTFFEKLIVSYDFSKIKPLRCLYECLCEFNDLDLFKMSFDNGVRFNNNFAIDAFSENYADTKKDIINFYLENGIDKDDLNREEIVMSYTYHTKTSLADLTEAMNINNKEIQKPSNIINKALDNHNFTFAVNFIKLGFKGLIQSYYRSQYSFNYKYEPDQSIYFTNFALEHGCTFLSTKQLPLVYSLLQDFKVKSFYIFTKHGHKIKEERKKISKKTCITFGKECGIPKEYIISVFE